MAKKEVGLQGSFQLDSVIGFLEDFAASLRKGKVYVQREQEFISLKPGSEVDLEIKATQKEDKERFFFEISWDILGEAARKSIGLKLTSTEPDTQLD